MTVLERTIVPAAEPETLRPFIDVTTGARLVLSNGEQVPLPGTLAEVLRVAAEALQSGKAVTVAPTSTVLTTQQAADLLGVSRPTLVKILERDGLPYTRPGRHRRIRLTDLLAYRDRMRDRQRHALDEIAAISQAAGLDELTGEPPIRR